MGKIALYRKYRSRDFSELLGQEHISKTLENAIKTGRVSHAYLFTGPRGTGKTSVARIMARRINGIEDGEGQGEVDIIEIDAASNNGVDEIRELRDKVHMAPNYRDYKVYIIDEVHMLSNAAFNALLKTLEEPPAHVIFIMATTEPHKLPQTIISRTQHFPFRPILSSTIEQHLEQIAAKEGIAIDADALKLLAELGEGSMRDSLSMLDQLGGYGDISAETVRAMIGRAHHPELLQLLEAILTHKTEPMLKILDSLIENGVSPRHLIKQLLEVVRDYVRSHLDDNDIKLYNARQLWQALSQIPSNTPNLALTLEAVLLQACFTAKTKADKGSAEPAFQQTATKNETKPVKQTAVKTKPKPHKGPERVQAGASKDKVWVKTLSLIKPQNASLYGLLRNVEVRFEDDVCVLSPKFQFHYRQLQNQRIVAAIKQALATACGQELELRVELADNASRAKKPTNSDQAEDQEIIGQVLDILGGEVV